MWYYATFLYFGNYYRKDPRERAGLAAAAIAVSVALNIWIAPFVLWLSTAGFASLHFASNDKFPLSNPRTLRYLIII